ncbi:multidrug/Oligosaccharidyl-lipid/Polysaccharide flippase, partial [Laccaria bicolor S238N-H82]
ADNGTGTTMFWEELRILTKYALPVFGTHLLEYSLVIVSVISIGHLSTNALAAVSLGSMTASVSGFSVLQGFSSALDTMLPSAWTSPHPHYVGLWTQRMTVVMSVSLIPMFLIWWNAETILLFLRQEPEVAHLASTYLRWVSLGLPAYAFNCISRYLHPFIRWLFTVPTRIIFIVAPFNAVLNYLLVWGPKPFRLGFIGAPLATAISFNLVSVMSIIYGIFFVDRTAWYPLSRRMFTSLGVLVQLGLSGVGQTASEWWAWELIGLAASLLGPVALATQSVLLVSASTTFQAPFALGVATSVRIGNLLGEQKAKRAGMAAKTSIIMALLLSMISSAMFLIFRNVWGYLFNNDPEVVGLVASILPLVALFQVFDGNAAVTGGILRARGKQFTGALLNLSAYYIVGIPFGIWLAFSWDMKLHGLWYGLTISLVYCAVLGTIICLRSDWDHEVDKVMNRL